LDDEERAERKAALEDVAGPVMLMSGVSREGLTDVLRAMRRQIEAHRKAERDLVEEPGPWRP
ncbi:MAG: GTPase ObgE, partial [Pseudomonadota bacterium]